MATEAGAQPAVPDLGKRVPDPGSFDPWVEIVADAVRHNVRELQRFTGRPLVAVIKNNANGIGLREVGPILDAMDEVHLLAVVRVDEALALRAVRVKKPILMMAHVSAPEARELVPLGVRLTLYHDDARQQVERLAAALGAPVTVHVKIDTGMNRIGMPFERALPWIQDLAASKAVRIESTYTMFSGARREDGSQFDTEHMRRFLAFVDQAKARGIKPGLLHGAPSSQVVNLPESHQLDLIRPGGAIYGLAAYRHNRAGEPVMDIRPVFRVRARLVRVERIKEGEGVSFGHRYIARRPTWIATIPVGHTDGYPREAPGKSFALIDGVPYPVIAAVSSNHVIAEIGDEKKVEVGDIATLVGPDHPDVTPEAVAKQTGLPSDYYVQNKLNALLLRTVV